MSEAASWVTLQEEGSLALLSLNRPEGNMLNGAIFDLLTEYLEQLGRSERTTVLLLQAEGADFSLGRERPPGPPPTTTQARTQLRKIQRTNEALMRFPGISIAAVQGRALGAGASLAGRCDLVLASENARFAFPEIMVPLAPTIVMSYYGKVLPRKAFFDLVVTGREVAAEEALRIGLVSRVVPSDSLEAAARALAAELVQRDAESLRLCKDFFRRLDRLEVEDAADYGIALLANEIASRAAQ